MIFTVGGFTGSLKKTAGFEILIIFPPVTHRHYEFKPEA